MATVVALVTWWTPSRRPVELVQTSASVSHVKAFPPGPDSVALRGCAHLPTAGTTTNECGVIDRLSDGAPVIMRCWDSTVAPASQDPSYDSAKWFFVTQASGPGHSGWVHSSQIPVHEQRATPRCTAAFVRAYLDANFEDPGPVSFAVAGSCTSEGGTLHGVSSGFTPGGTYSVAAAGPDGSAYPVRSEGTVRGDGSVEWIWPCAGDPPGAYTTTVVDLKTGRSTGAVGFTIGEPPLPVVTTADTAPPTTRPRPTTTTTSAKPSPTTTTTTTTTTTPAPTTTTTTTTTAPKPVISNFVVYAHGNGQAGVAFDLAWQEDRDPMTCRFYIDGVLSHGPVQCGVRPSKQFSLPPGNHAFDVTAHDRFGVYADPPATIVRYIH